MLIADSDFARLTRNRIDPRRFKLFFDNIVVVIIRDETGK